MHGQPHIRFICFISVKEFSTFGHCAGVYFLRNIKSIPFLSEQSLLRGGVVEGGVEGFVLEIEGLEVQRGLNFWVAE